MAMFRRAKPTITEIEEALESQTLQGSLKSLPDRMQLDTEYQEENAANLLTALGHPTRLRIVALLRRQPLPVGQIALDTNISQANISQHLAVLLRAGALVVSREGTSRTYSLRGPAIGKILDLIEELQHAGRDDVDVQQAV